MVAIGDSVSIAVLGETSIERGIVSSVYHDVEGRQDEVVVELEGGSVGIVKSVAPQRSSPAVALGKELLEHNDRVAASCDGKHIQIGTHVQVQAFKEAVALEHGRVAEVIENSPEQQPVVKLVSGTIGAVTMVQCESLPPVQQCVDLLQSGQAIVVEPMGVSVTELAIFSDILEAQASTLYVSCCSIKDGSEMHGALAAFMVPCLSEAAVERAAQAGQNASKSLSAAAAVFTPGGAAKRGAGNGYSDAYALSASPDSGYSGYGDGLAEGMGAMHLGAEERSWRSGHMPTVGMGSDWGGAASQSYIGSNKAAPAAADSESETASASTEAMLWEDALTPRLAALYEACARLRLSYSSAETLAVLNQYASADRIVAVMQQYPDSLEAAANDLLIESERVRGSQPNPRGLSPDAGSTGGDTSRNGSEIGNDSGHGGVKGRRRKGRNKGRALDGCFGAPPNHQGWRAQPAPDIVNEDPVYRGTGNTSGPYVRGSEANQPGASAGPHGAAPEDSSVASGWLRADMAVDNELPDFLLPFIAEHVHAVETAGDREAAAKSAAAEWTKVSSKASRAKKGGGGKRALSLYSAELSTYCKRELNKVSEMTAERLRILTICSAAANMRRLYDKSAVDKVKQCNEAIGSTLDDVVKAYVLAARNTTLGTNAASLDLHYMNKTYAERVVRAVVRTLQDKKQAGQLQIVTGKGLNAHNNRANLKALVIELLESLRVPWSRHETNDGLIVADIYS